MINFRKAFFLALLLSLVNFISACGDNEKDPDTIESISGSWAGPRTISKDGLDLVDSEAFIIFDKETFKYENSTKNESAEGSYALVGDKHIKFTAVKSTSTLFPIDDSVLMNLTINQSSIIISNDNFELILTKISDSANSPDQRDKEVDNDNPFISSSCNMKLKKSIWKFEFSNATKFKLITNEGRRDSSFAIGDIKLQKPANIALLEITKTSISGLSSQKILVESIDAKKFLIGIYSKNDEEIFKGNCYQIY